MLGIGYLPWTESENLTTVSFRSTALASETWSGTGSGLLLDYDQEPSYQEAESSREEPPAPIRLESSEESGVGLETSYHLKGVHHAFPFNQGTGHEAGSGTASTPNPYPLLASYSPDSSTYHPNSAWIGFPGQPSNEDLGQHLRSTPQSREKRRAEEHVTQEGDGTDLTSSCSVSKAMCFIKQEKPEESVEPTSQETNLANNKDEEFMEESQPDKDQDEALGAEPILQDKPNSVAEEEHFEEDDEEDIPSTSSLSPDSSQDSDDSFIQEIIKKTQSKRKAAAKPKYFADDEVFVCNECGVQTNWSWMLVAHKYITHAQNSAVRCDICRHEDDNNSWKELSNHMRTTHGLKKFVDPNEDNNYFCNSCQEIHTGLLSYLFHWEGIHSNTMFQCSTCKFVTIHRYIIARHMERLHGTMEFDTYKTQINEIKRPKKAMRQETFSQCLVCGVKMDMGTLTEHLKNQHPDSVKYQMFPCCYCGSMKKTHPDLKQHVKIHGDEKYLCTECDYKTAVVMRLRKHVDAVHLNMKLFPCSECNVRFRSPCARRGHQRSVHHGHRDFLCPTCGRGFKRSDALAVHIRIHTDEKPLACKFCDYRCRQQASMKWHLKKHNNDLS